MDEVMDKILYEILKKSDNEDLLVNDALIAYFSDYVKEKYGLFTKKDLLLILERNLKISEII